MITLVILFTLCTLVYPVYSTCLPLSYCILCIYIPLYILFTHVYPCHTLVYPVYPIHTVYVPCIPLNRLCREITKLVKRIGALKSNCGPLFRTLTHPPNVLLGIIGKIKFSIEKWRLYWNVGPGRQTGATWGPPECCWTNKSWMPGGF